MSFVDVSLARRLEMAQAWRGVCYARAQQALHPEIPVQIESVAGGYLLYAGDGSPLNRAVGLGFDGPVAAADLDRVEQFFRRRRIPPRLDLCPLADASLAELLKAGGYRLEGFRNVLMCSLAEPGAPGPWPAGIRVSQAGPEEAALWLKTVAQGFDGAATPTQATLDILAPNFYSTNATCFFAWIKGQPAGGGGMYIHEGVAELGGASTRPEYRRRGVQTALLHARLAAARERGCDLAAVMTLAGSDSQRNIERVGFRLAYTKVIMMRDEG